MTIEPHFVVDVAIGHVIFYRAAQRSLVCCGTSKARNRELIAECLKVSKFAWPFILLLNAVVFVVIVPFVAVAALVSLIVHRIRMMRPRA